MAKVLGSNKDFPKGNLKHEPHRGQYTFRWTISKITGDSEQTGVEVIANPVELAAMVTQAYALIDARMFQQNQRYLDATEMSKGLPPEVAMQVKRIIEKVHGRVPVEDRLNAQHQEGAHGDQEAGE